MLGVSSILDQDALAFPAVPACQAAPLLILQRSDPSAKASPFHMSYSGNFLWPCGRGFTYLNVYGPYGLVRPCTAYRTILSQTSLSTSSPLLFNSLSLHIHILNSSQHSHKVVSELVWWKEKLLSLASEDSSGEMKRPLLTILNKGVNLISSILICLDRFISWLYYVLSLIPLRVYSF